MTNAELDVLWSRALQESVAAGEMYTRYRFAALVAEAEREARQAAQRQVTDLQERLNRADAERCAAVLAEREACAKVCKSISDKWAVGYYGHEVDAVDECVAAIRSRGQA